MRNPFTLEFVEEEVSDLELIEYTSASIQVQYEPLIGRVDDYLNVSNHHGELDIPVFRIDGKIWMSLSPMEIQSNYLPIRRAAGRVATAGLGLGYFAIRAAQKPSVTSVDVFEVNTDVIEYFVACYQSRPEFRKIRILEGDARENILLEAEDEPYDFLYVDIYNAICPEVALVDLELFMLQHDCARLYSFWGKERLLLDALQNGFRPPMKHSEAAFFDLWQSTTFEDGRALAAAYRPLLDTQYLSRGVEVLEELKAVLSSRELKRRQTSKKHVWPKQFFASCAA